jgi:hypothetical protein
MNTKSSTLDHQTGYTTEEIERYYDHQERSARRRRWLLGAGAGAILASGVTAAVLMFGSAGSPPSAPAAPATSTSTANPAVPSHPTVNPAVPSHPIVNPAVPASPAQGTGTSVG